MRYSQQSMHVASRVTCLRATSIEIMDRWHATLRPYQGYFSQTARCEGDIMKGWLQSTNCRRQWDLNPESLGQQASAKPTELPELLHNDQ